MATVTRENIGLLTDKISVSLQKEDYFAEFEKSLKQYAKQANIPGFRKGMVPAGLVKKMYGQGVFADQVIKQVEKSLMDYLQKEQLDIFAQPLPLESNNQNLDMNAPGEYVFNFEVGLKPNFDVNLSNVKVKRFEVVVTDEMINEEVSRLQSRYGKMTDPEEVTNDENMLNVTFTEIDADGNVPEGGINKANSLLVKYFSPAFRAQLMGKKKDDVVDVHLATAFEDKERSWILNDLGIDANVAGAADRNFKMTITKVGLIEKAPLAEELYKASFPEQNITTEEEFRAAIRTNIEQYYAQQARNQIHDQIYHSLVDHTTMDLPEGFLKRWIQEGGEQRKSAEEAEKEYPSFANSLKWTLISSKLQQDEAIQVVPDDIREFAKQQLLGYMGGQLGALGDNQAWIDDYVNRMMKDKKYVEDSYHRIATEKLFHALENKVTAVAESISAEDFVKRVEEHQHHH